MHKLPRITAVEAEKMLLKAGFKKVRSKGSHRIYQKGKIRTIVPYHISNFLLP